MQIAFLLYVAAVVIMLAAVWYRDWKYPFMQRTPHWTKSIPHKIALGTFGLAIVFMVTFLWLYFKEMI